MTRHLLILPILLITILQAECKQLNFGHLDYKDGLSNNRILCFAEDDNGFIWIGTTSGLNRYDGYNFETFLNSSADSNSLSDNMVHTITKDQFGRLWILTAKGMSLFNPNTLQFQNSLNATINNKVFDLSAANCVIPFHDSTLLFYLPDIGLFEHNIYKNTFNELVLTGYYANLFSKSELTDISISGDLLFTLARDGSINIINLVSKEHKKHLSTLKNYIKDVNHDYQFYIDHLKNIWIYSNDHDLGVIIIDKNAHIKHLTTESTPALNSNIISTVIQDSDDNYWIGTDHGGLNIIDSNQESIQHIVNNENIENSLSQNVITEIFRSSDDMMWIGTFKQGVNLYHKNLFQFTHYKHQPSVKNSLPYNDVNCFAEDKTGNLWIGTNGNGLIYFNREDNSFTTLNSNDPKAKNLKSDVIVSLYVDDKNLLWVGTYHGGLSIYNGEQFQTFLNDPNNTKTISDNRIWEIYEDSNQNIWIGTLGGGLNLFDRNKKDFKQFSKTGENSINSNFIIDIKEDHEGNLWFGTDYGIFILTPDFSKIRHLKHNSNQLSSLSDNFVSKILIDSKNKVWVGTRNGLNLYNETSESFTRFNTTNGLPNNSVMGILESEEGDIWVSTSGGLCKLIIVYNTDGSYQSHYTVKYNESDGLQGREFNEGSAYKTSRGELIFGGANGFNICLPKVESVKPQLYKTQITELEIFGETIAINTPEGNKKNISTSILNGKNIKLPYRENIFSLKFSATDFLFAKKTNYRYKLEGFNKQWIYTTWQDRKATFTNLNPGKYTFKVQSSYNNAGWSKSEGLVNIIIMPPWYRTWLAYSIFALIIFGIIIISRKSVIRKERAKFKQEQAEKESKRQQELSALKTRFFTNISHEFRTPLTLILTPLEKLIKTSSDDNSKKHLSLIFQNAKRLLTLVNQLLDFRKIEENKIQVNYIYGNVIGFIKFLTESFTDYQETKKVTLDFLPDEQELFMQFDKDKLEKILFNLISNAFKFTPEGGYIRVFSEVVHIEQTEYFKITIKDSGIGISTDQLPKIFDRFYQSDLPNDFITKGSGIGLSLTKDFIDLLNGTINVQSKINKGTSFIVQLPLNRSIPNYISEENSWKNETELNGITKENYKTAPEKNKKTILLVEDNPDFRYYLNDSLQAKFNILEAENGQIALDTLKVNNPDLIVSDVMMPVMDGLTFCNTIKTNASFSHIPIILLTAKSTPQDKLDGLHQGADEYITKPFNLDILEARIDYLLTQRKKFINQYQKSFKVEIENSSITPLDEKLLKRIHEFINKNLSNSEYSVDKLSKDVGISRVYLYKKTTSLAGITPVELIRLIRLRKAAELLIQGHLNINEITYEVGFNDPKYFSKQFKAEFGEIPSKYRNSHIDE